ncbi:glycogen synthase [Candidatus Parcubacteria bacterium]|nr:MAG: glycogen synthase [Candidatus Parcubacteria bacterium]
MSVKKLEIIMAGAEMAPFVKVGGLGDVVGSLPIALAKLGVKVKVFLPFYGSINSKKFKVKTFYQGLSAEVNGSKHKFDIYHSNFLGRNIEVFFIKNTAFNSKDIYVGGRKYFNKNKTGAYTRKVGDVERFIFFSKAVIETIKELKLKPDIIHAHDWHTAMMPTFIDEYSLKYDNFKNIKSIYTIHNLANQGVAGLDILDYAGLDKDVTPSVMEDYYDKDGGKINSMKLGILSADYVNTVSPNYAKEILTKEYGADLEDYLNRRKKNLFGIVNGLDLALFDPLKDKNIKKKYSLKNFKVAKDINKKNLQKVSKLAIDDVPVFGLVSRLVSQKGLDILLPALEKYLKHNNFQVVVLGTGRKEFEDGFKNLAKQHPDKVSANITFSLALAQKIYAGSDFFLMPSLFEPCGLGQMIAMRYGTVPVVRATGGLKDTVENDKTGIVFKKYTQHEMISALDKALKLYKNKSKFDKIIKAGMREDFSWDKSAKEYLKLYNKLR